MYFHGFKVKLQATPKTFPLDTGAAMRTDPLHCRLAQNVAAFRQPRCSATAAPATRNGWRTTNRFLNHAATIPCPLNSKLPDTTQRWY
jgi:hypothetical protein